MALIKSPLLSLSALTAFRREQDTWFVRGWTDCQHATQSQIRPTACTHLLHDQVNVLCVDALLIDRRAIVLLVLFLLLLVCASGTSLTQLAELLAQHAFLLFRLCHLLCLGSLRLSRRIFRLELAKHNVAIRN